MFSMLKFAIAFCFSFLILSIPVQNQPLFYYLNDWASPITKEVFTGTKNTLLDGVKKTKKVGSKLFNNTTPKKDEISLQSSSIDKVELKKHLDHAENYTAEERGMLEKIILDNK